jgi:hypothetical protein
MGKQGRFKNGLLTKLVDRLGFTERLCAQKILLLPHLTFYSLELVELLQAVSNPSSVV